MQPIHMEQRVIPDTLSPEMTLRTLLEMHIAEQVNAIGVIRQMIGEGIVTTLNGDTVYDPTNWTSHRQGGPNRAWLTLQVHHKEAFSWADVHTGAISWDNYNNAKSLHLFTPTLVHTAVAEALRDLVEYAKQMRVEVDAGLSRSILALPSVPTVEELLPTGIWVQEPHNTHGLWPYGFSALVLGEGFRVGLDTPIWQVREQHRLLSGVYPPLPDEVSAVLPDEVKQQQVPHLATKAGNAGMIAYTQSPVAGALDRQQVMKAGRYLRQNCPDLSDEQVKQLSALVASRFNADMHITRDPDLVAEIYENGPGSCMAYGPDDKHFRRLIVNGQFFHPTRVYIHPENNIALAYMVYKDRYVARTLINTKHKQFYRVYQSDSVSSARERLTQWLLDQGYSTNYEYLDGEKLLRVSPDDYPNAIICPYIDPDNRGVHIRNDHLLVNGNHSANHETGCLNDYDTRPIDWYCDDCDDGYSDDDDRYHIYDTDAHVCGNCIGGYTEAYIPDGGYYACVRDDVYEDRSEHGRRGYVYMGGDHGDYVILDPDRYDAEVARNGCVWLPDEGEYILTRDAEQFDIIIDGNEGFSADDYVELDGELIPNEDLPDEGVSELPSPSGNYQGAQPKAYVTLEEEQAA